MKFIEVADCFNAIEPITSRLDITALLADLLKKASPEEAQIIAYLSLGQMRSPYAGMHFNIAEKNMIKAVADFLDTPLLDIQQKMKQLGDIGLVIAQHSWDVTEHLSVAEVYHRLETLEKLSGAGSQDEKMHYLSGLFSQLDQCSAKFIARIIVGKLRLGFSDMTLIDALSWMEVGSKALRGQLENAYNICADIGMIAKTVKELGIDGINKMHIQIGIPIVPSAAERLPTAEAIFDKIGVCYAEPKLDGLRVQIHLDKTGVEPNVRFFSRNLQDMSAMFPDIAKEVLKLNVQELICEGEVLCYDNNTGAFLPFQETAKRKRKHGIDDITSDFPAKVFLFDLLYLDGKDYLDVTYLNRRIALQGMMSSISSDQVLVNQSREMTSGKMLYDYFIETVSFGLEGLVVKRPHAIYQPGKRNFNWIKLKRQEEGHLEDTLDCVVLGYYAGKGKRSSFGVGAFLVGIYNKELDMFQTIAKIGTGMTDDEWRALKKQCDELHSDTQPKNVVCPKELAPDVWVEPTIMCRIRADEITLSPVHTAAKTAATLGYALRFPRFMDYRMDKSIQEATTDLEVKRLYQDQFLVKDHHGIAQ